MIAAQQVRETAGGQIMKRAYSLILQDAVIKRINRKLDELHPGEFVRVRKSRGLSQESQLGEFYLHARARNLVEETHVDLLEMAKQFQVVSHFEQTILGAQALVDRK
jgi:hypothetical protein